MATPQWRRLLFIGSRTSLFAGLHGLLRWGKTPCRGSRSAPFAQFLRRCLIFPLGMSTGAERKQSRLRRNSIVVQLFLRPGSAFRSSGGSPPREFPRRLARNGAAFGSFALIRFLFVRAVSSAGKTTMKALPTRRAVQLVRHHRFFLRLPSQDPRKKIRRDSARVAHRANLSPAPSCFLVSGHGDSAIASTPLNWFANVAFCPPARVRAPGDYAMAILPKCPFAQFLRRCLFRPLER